MEVEGWTVNVGQDGEVGGGEAPFLSGLSPSDCPPLSYDPIEGEKTPEEEKKREKKEKKNPIASEKRKCLLFLGCFRPSADCTNGMTVEKKAGQQNVN